MTQGPILVALDDAARTDDAAYAGMELARVLDCGVEYLHALELPRMSDLDSRTSLHMAARLGDILEQRANELTTRLERIVASAGRPTEGVRDQIVVRQGNAASELVARAKQTSARLIVLGPHEKQAVFDLGGTARAVLGAAPCDVWMQHGPWKAPRTILVPVDLSEHSLAALSSACGLAQRLGAELIVLHAWYAPELYGGALGAYPVGEISFPFDEARESAKSAFEEAISSAGSQGVRISTRFVDSRAVDAILENEADADLIALGSHGRTGLASAVLGNTAYSVMKRAHRPVLAIRHPERDWLLA